MKRSSHGEYTYELDGETAKLTRYEGSDDELIVPEKIEGLPVISIDSNAFATNAFQTDYSVTIKSLTIENPDILIDDRHRVNFSGIRTIYLPDGMTEIPDSAFILSSGVEEIVIPDSVTSIGSKAFEDMDELKKLELPAGITDIGYGAFFECELPEGISFKGENEYYEIKDHMLLTKDGAMLLAIFPSDDIADVTVPDGVEVIAPYVHCGGYKNGESTGIRHLRLPGSLTKVLYGAFRNESFEELTIPDSVCEIGSFAFDCSGYISGGGNHVIDSISFGSGVSWLGETIIGKATYRSLSVSQDNRFYAAAVNRLTNKHGDADLSTKELSSSDNLAVNKVEYEAYKMATDGVDLSLYDTSETESDNKEYNGTPYSLKLTLKESEQLNYQIKDFDGKVELFGTEMTLPCAYDDFIKTGMTPDEDSQEKLQQKVGFSALLFFESDNHAKASVSLRNPGSTDAPVQQCKVVKLSMTPYYGEDASSYGLNYHGLTGASTPQDAIRILGAPSSVRIASASESYVSIYMDYYMYKEEYGYVGKSAGCELSFRYIPKDGKTKLTEFSLDMGE